MEQQEIEELVTRVIEGDMAAFEELYKRTSKRVYYTCMSFLRNEQNVNDAMQDTYLMALTHLNQLQDRKRFSAWVNQIAVNKCRNMLAKKEPQTLEEEPAEWEPAEENENFLPESYVTVKAKREIIMNIMLECLSAVQYQTVILYYFDGLSVKEIAQCMDCLEGTVKFRLSAARAKIKAEVQEYEDTSGEKLYSSAAMPLLTAVLVAETQGLVVPELAEGIMRVFTGTFTGTVGGVSASTGAIAAKATGKGLGAVFKTLKAKIIAGAVAGTLAVGGAAFIIHNQKQETVEETGYTEVNDVICDNEYFKVTITKIYTLESLDEMFSEKISNDTYIPVQYEFVNKTDESFMVEMNALTVNGLCRNNNYDAITYEVLPNQTVSQWVSNGQLDNTGKFLREEYTGGKMSLFVYQYDGGIDPDHRVVYENKVFDYFPFGEENYVEYQKEGIFDGGQVVLDNDQIKITSIGYVEEYSYCYQGFYVENKTNHPFQLSIGTCDYDDFGGYVFLEAGAEACPVLGISETDAFKSADTMEVMFHLYSGESYSDYVLDYFNYELNPQTETVQVPIFPYN